MNWFSLNIIIIKKWGEEEIKSKNASRSVAELLLKQKKKKRLYSDEEGSWNCSKLSMENIYVQFSFIFFLVLMRLRKGNQD